MSMNPLLSLAHDARTRRAEYDALCRIPSPPELHFLVEHDLKVRRAQRAALEAEDRYTKALDEECRK